jgi:uncharacterized phage protein (TIGR02220 family)
MYGKIFDSIYDGTLRANWKALVTFQQLIILCDSAGTIDMTPHAIHGRTGIPLDIIEEGLLHLSQPDPHSRSSEAEGRRIVLLEDHRPWGWRLVNHNYYRNLLSIEDKREKDRVRIAATRRDKSQPVANSSEQSPSVADVAHTNTNTNTNTKETLSGKAPDADPLNGKKVNLKQTAREILDFLNTKTGKNFHPVSANIDLICARLKEGYTPSQLRQVIARQYREWNGDEKMQGYLRPATLFNKSKCANYVGELVVKEAARA